MENSSVVTSIILSKYYGMEHLKYMYFSIFLILYILIVAENVILIGVIYTEKTLHQPMYFFVCNLAANGLYGSTGLMPALLSHLTSHTHEVSIPLCQIQIYCLHTFAIGEFTILAVMSYDRYVAICYPLQYHMMMSLSKVYKLIAFTWLYPMVVFLLFFIITIQLRICGNNIDRLYCTNHSLYSLSCTDTSMLAFVGLLSLFFYTCPQLAMTFYSYVHILRICVLSSKESRIKALQTCTPHIFAVINYAIGCFYEMLQRSFDTRHLPYATHVFLSLYFLIFPPILNPAIYGISIKAIRVPLLKLCHGKNRVLQK